MTRMTQSQALDFIESTFDTAPDYISADVVEAWVYDLTVDQVRADMDSFMAFIGASFDEKSITIAADVVEGSNIPATRIVIMVEGG